MLPDSSAYLIIAGQCSFSMCRIRLSEAANLLLNMGHRKRGQAFLYFEILQFSTTFLAKKVVFLVSRSKNEISLLGLPSKKPSDTHAA